MNGERVLTIRWHLPREACEFDSAPAEPLALSFDIRKRSRQRLELPDGRILAIALAPGTVLRPGDRLDTHDGIRFTIRAADEPVLHITADSTHALMRAAYHLGNRHIPVEVGDGYLAIEPDPVLDAMLQQLGVATHHRNAPFAPETGAYGGGHRHGHDATFAEDHALAQRAFDANG